MSNLLDGKTAVVTGGSSGIGRGISLELAKHGADVVVADIRRGARGQDIPDTVDVIEDETDSRAAYVDCDVTEYAEVAAAVDSAEEFGGIDVMVNNAGFVERAELFEATEEEYYAMTDVMLKGVFFGCQAAGERMVESGGGSIINIASTATDRGYAGPGAFFYGAAKGGVKAMAYSLAEELGPDGVRVNTIQPGYTKETGLSKDATAPEGMTIEEFQKERGNETALNRLGTPFDIGGAAVFFASDLSSYVTAAELLVDGGWVHTGGP